MPDFEIFSVADEVTALLLAAGLYAASMIDKKLIAIRWWAGFYVLIAASIATTPATPISSATWMEAATWIFLYGAVSLVAFGMYFEGERENSPYWALAGGGVLLALILIALYALKAPHAAWMLLGPVPSVIFILWAAVRLFVQKPPSMKNWIYAMILLVGVTLIVLRSAWFAAAGNAPTPIASISGYPELLYNPVPAGPPPPIDPPLILSLATILVMVSVAITLVLHIALTTVDRMWERSTTDVLSGLFNRATFDEQAALALKDAGSKPVSAMIFDIDHFKRVNDTYGHQAGDRVITALGHVISEGMAEHHIAGRIGGEEFAVVLPGANLQVARLFAEAVRTKFASLPFGMKPSFSATVSAGISQRKGEEPLNALLSRADKALYVAKNSGRDRVAVDPSEEAMFELGDRQAL
jgi:diguanylate cyclase (GGDEF)-like protein